MNWPWPDQSKRDRVSFAKRRAGWIMGVPVLLLKGGRMFIAMNRFRIARGREFEFEAMWRARESYLDEVDGFIEFHLLHGPEAEDHTLFVSHSVWESRTAFEAWTRSEAFRKAHAQAGAAKGVYLGPPQIELFEVVI